MSIKDSLFGKKTIGKPVRVIGKSENDIEIVDGLVIIRKEGGVVISYRWIDETSHDYITRGNSFIGYNRGLPLFPHNVGEIYQTTTPSLITSEYWNSINNSHIGSQITTDTKELREGGLNLPWKMILIVGGVILIFAVLWNNGFIQRLYNEIPSGSPAPTMNDTTITPIDPKRTLGE